MNKFCRDQVTFPIRAEDRFSKIRQLDNFYICLDCNGIGLDIVRCGDLTIWDGSNAICNTCEGLGIFDWVENVVCGIKTKLVKREEFNAAT